MTGPDRSQAPVGYITGLKTLLVSALRLVFDSEYPEPDFRNIYVSIEYPVEEHNTPSIWVDYEDVQDLSTAGISHVEYIENSDGTFTKCKRWRYGGYATFSLVALTSLERDRLTDNLVALIAFGEENPATAQFRQYITENEFIACSFDWDRVKVTAKSESQGTPWGSDDIVYERTLAVSCFGEFVSEGQTNRLAPLSQVTITPIKQGDPDPTDPSKGPPPDGGWL